jgi:hypothetical protein
VTSPWAYVRIKGTSNTTTHLVQGTDSVAGMVLVFNGLASQHGSHLESVRTD